ncbi:hypothetical protein AXG93_1311s1030 [Marchantia polymorpha subsp. ruderalis]|uniref:CCHC-type domain-containing protein n=1 Tax=Marchantia polymorpha subsp. ruderalis TaxID=1480154 RepID=A0A176VSI8_MARPO|nr:hypothetical protein AXG93_1311s1030 [Marchantia polymorpha subsp. ruderalis]
MANPQGNPYPPLFTKHSYLKFKGRGDDDDADSYIKLFELVSITNKEDNDADQMRIFPGLPRKKAQNEKPWKKANRKKKNRRMAMHEKGSTSILSKVDALVKDFADLKVHVVGSRYKRKSSTGLRANLLCTNYVGGYYTENLEETAYAVQEGPPVTPIQQAHIPRYAPNEIATTVPQRRMVSPGATARVPPNACFNCGEARHYSPNCSHPRREQGYVPMCSNCRQGGHTAAECNQPRAARAQVRFVTPPPKEDAKVNLVDLSPEGKEEDSSWSDEEIMVGREDTPPKTSGSLAKNAKSSAKDLWSLSQEDFQSDGLALPLLRKAYAPDIKDDVGNLLCEELDKTPPSKELDKAAPKTKASSCAERHGGASELLRDPHYDIVADLFDRQANITFWQLVEDNNAYWKLITIALKRPKRTRAHKLPRVYQVLHEDLGPPEIDIEIGGCTIRKVPLDSRSGINIMTEETAHALGYKTFQPTNRMIRMADQTQRKSLGTLKDVQTIINGVVFPLNYIIIKSLTKMGSHRVLKISSQVTGAELERIQRFLRAYEDVFAWRIEDMKGIPARYGEHRIDLMNNAVSVRQRQYRLNPKYFLLVKNKIDKYLSA